MTDILSNFSFLIVLFVTNTIQTITGFAGTLLAMPPAIKLVGVENAKAVLNIFTIFACAGIAYQNRKNINKKELCKIIVGMVVGMVIGVRLFAVIPQQILLTGYGILIIGVAVKNLVSKKSMELNKVLKIVILVAAGIIHGMFVSGGSLLVVYAAAVLKDKDEFRATISPVWVILNTLLIYSHFTEGYYTMTNFIVILLSIIPLIISIKIGNILYKRIDQKTFLKISYILLILSGLLVII